MSSTVLAEQPSLAQSQASQIGSTLSHEISGKQSKSQSGAHSPR
jgi:hypothetical protein